MKRIILFCLLSFVKLSLYSQQIKIVKYFDSTWYPTTKSDAYFYTEFIQQGGLYNCFSYWVSSGKLNCTSVYKDTLFEKPAGLLRRYYENGQLEDSTYLFENGRIKNTYHYYTSGRLWAHVYYDAAKDKDITEGYDEQGKPIKNFVYLREAEFPGGSSAWKEYLKTTLNAKVPVKKGAPKGTYIVMIKFAVEMNGTISNVEAETTFGYGMEEEAIRVIKKSPKWIPVIALGKTKRALRRQPITFEILEYTFEH